MGAEEDGSKKNSTGRKEWSFLVFSQRECLLMCLRRLAGKSDRFTYIHSLVEV